MSNCSRVPLHLIECIVCIQPHSTSPLDALAILSIATFSLTKETRVKQRNLTLNKRSIMTMSLISTEKKLVTSSLSISRTRNTKTPYSVPTVHRRREVRADDPASKIRHGLCEEKTPHHLTLTLTTTSSWPMPSSSGRDRGARAQTRSAPSSTPTSSALRHVRFMALQTRPS